MASQDTDPAETRRAGGGSGPTTGTISGTVTDSLSADTLPGVEVTATDGATGGVVLATAMTDTFGWYSLTVPILESGQYFRLRN